MQEFLYLTANKRLPQGLCHKKMSGGENYNNGTFRYFWPQAKILAAKLAAFPLHWVCRCHKSEPCQKWTVRQHVWCVSFGWAGFAVVATGIFLGHLFLLMAWLTLLSKYLDLNSHSPLGGQNKLFNWYTVRPQTVEFRGRRRWVTGVNRRTKGYSTERRIYILRYIAGVTLNVPAPSDLCWRDNTALPSQDVKLRLNSLLSGLLIKAEEDRMFVCDKETQHFICLLVCLMCERWTCRQRKLRCTKDQNHQQELMRCLFCHRHSFGSPACLRLFNIACYCEEVKHVAFIPSITSEPYESCYVWNRAQHECHCALSRQVVLLLFPSRNR